MVAACSLASQAQDPSPTPANIAVHDPMGENERITFLQTDQAPDAPEPGSGSLILKTLGSMALIVGLIFAGAWAVRKLGIGGVRPDTSTDGIALTVLSTVSLGSGRSISTIRFGDRVLVVGSTAQEFTLLAEETVASEPGYGQSRSVAEMLAENNDSFDKEFSRATTQLDSRYQRGANV